MGRGDKRTAKGKRFKGSFGVSRLHKAKTTVAAAKPATGDAATAEAKPKAAAKKKAAPKKKEE